MRTVRVFKTLLLAGVGSAILSTAAFAADAAEVAVPEESAWDISFGATITSDYVGRGLTATDGGPAIQPWAELTVGWFYAGYWGSNVVDDWENDVSVGVRPELGPVSLDLGYVQYHYSVAGDGGGEAYITGEISPVDPLTIGGGFWYGVGALQDQNYAEVNAAIDLVESLSASAAFGWVMDPNGNANGDYTTWNAGVTWNPVEPLEIDVRYHYAPATVAPEAVQKVVISASISSSLRSIGALK